MYEILAEKQKLRKKYKKIRDAIPNRLNKSVVITDKIIENTYYKQSKVIALFKNFGSEVNTDKIIEHAISVGKIVVLPRVENDELKFYKIKSLNDNFLISKLGIEEPICNENNYVENKEIDLFIVPGLCFDREKNRLGYGKGYYDRILNKTNAKSIAICFKEQILKDELLPIIDTDVKVQTIISD